MSGLLSQGLLSNKKLSGAISAVINSFNFLDDFAYSTGWTILSGTFNFVKNALTPNTRSGAGVINTGATQSCSMSKNLSYILDSDFEINFKAKNLNTAASMGGFSIGLRKGTNIVFSIRCYDGWTDNANTILDIKYGATVLYATGSSSAIFSNIYEIISIKRIANVMSLYKGPEAITSAIAFSDIIDFDNVVVEFDGYTGQTLPTLQLDYLEIKSA
jgi:hypothetical protein